MNRDWSRLVFALALVAGGQPALADWQCSTLGGRPVPARAVSDFLDRARQVYPSQLLGMVRSSDRLYLVNAGDEGWSERVRLGLMELRLAEPDITAARRFQGAVAGAADVEIPAGEFVCLARARAGRHGLTLTGRGEMLLAPGKSVHLVDPHEAAIVVEVRAFGSEPLDFREILALSGRSGIYAGLAGRRAPPGAPAAVRQPGDAIVVALGPAGQLGEIVVTPRAQDGGEKIEEKPATTAAAVVPPVPAPVVAPAPAPRVAEEPPARVVKVDAPAAPSPATPLPPEAPVTVAIAVVEPVAVAVSARAPAAQAAARPGAGQSYEEYANTMKTLLALRRSGSVRSISEMTYVHPAVEDLRAQRR